MQPEQRGGMKLRIKFGNKVTATLHVPASGPSSRCATSDPSSLPESLQGQVHAVNAKKEKLKDYVKPSASPSRIVAAIRDGGFSIFEDFQRLPSWDDSLAIPSSLRPLLDRPQLEDERPAKRARQSAAPGKVLGTEVVQSAIPVSVSGPACTTGHPAGSPASSPAADHATAGSSQHSQAEDEGRLGTSAKNGMESLGIVQAPGSSSSDQATTLAYSMSSPEHGELLVGPVSAPGSTKKQAPKAVVTTSSIRNQPAAPSLSVQAGQGTILPSPLLELSGHSDAANSMRSISPFDLQMPTISRRSAEQITDEVVTRKVEAAQNVKRSADQQRGSVTSPWSIVALSKYVESALMFMEACEYILQMPKSHDRQVRVKGLYGATAELLSYAIKFVETAKGSDMAKEALRILAERLCAVCCMREAAHGANRYTSEATRIDTMLAKYKQQQKQQQPPAPAPGRNLPAGPSAGNAIKQAAHSPDDSTNSSQDVVSASQQQQQLQRQQLTASMMAELSQVQQRLMGAAKQVARFSEMIRRSTINFQAFIERADFKTSNDAKLASMHMAVVCMDVGMIDGYKLIAHAHEAIARIRLL
mmetsp:Transcript_40163/g.89110  ORF Transcript_40163/g.89110 Transcript_40163/m.89110 type:complete len:587 (+) Transcript_40163:120-1880(+)|eukprot:CAMPEP_0202899464 /NCGR_PEP_ID=MMETSP1392-20130828/7682_1 /ASSEMBLY_ACC=CAM_ASM_000868 /TAXON_ID=225041 /ORGANISM="Chlamydomonas chlamydogama, Strain SAG 11-48b" /LENGTH=586 /DNA_ID=CAMNT_0049585647 /DNA_START=108 /DNA_END=1868 /DNA_ORIENTATION=+